MITVKRLTLEDARIILEAAEAKAKAFTAAGHRRATHKFNASPSGSALPGNEAFGIHAMHPGRFAIFVGGFPIEVEGDVVGGVGISGGNGEQDTQVGEAGIAAFLASLKG